MDEQVVALKQAISEQAAIIIDLESALSELEQEIAEFKQKYDRVVQPMATRVEIAKDAIRELENHQIFKNWTPPPNYVPVAEQFDRAWRKPPLEQEEIPVSPPPITLIAETPPEERDLELKKIYRQLARRFHPDRATDEADNYYRTRIMSQINDAYAQKDLEALQALAMQPENANPEEPVAALYLHQLKILHRQQEHRIFDLKQQKHRLMQSDLMKLKIEEKLLIRQGRDLLKEMAQHLEKEYLLCQKKLESLRRS